MVINSSIYINDDNILYLYSQVPNYNLEFFYIYIFSMILLIILYVNKVYFNGSLLHLVAD